MNFPINACSTLKSLFHFTIPKLRLRKSQRRKLSSGSFSRARWGLMMSGSHGSCWHIEHHTHTWTQIKVRHSRKELEIEFNKEIRQSVLIRHSTHHVSVLTSPFYPPFCWCVFLLHAHSSSNHHDPSWFFTWTSRNQTCTSLKGIMSPMALLAITLQPV